MCLHPACLCVLFYTVILELTGTLVKSLVMPGSFVNGILRRVLVGSLQFLDLQEAQNEGRWPGDLAQRHSRVKIPSERCAAETLQQSGARGELMMDSIRQGHWASASQDQCGGRARG